ncbi:hypothetical protein [Afipia sp. 1NLS2]|uniref:hypothetical protein n=1 Tax=Afipia sp. 1NLS2 TaxID=666684 RepID=UPI0001D9E6EF|nr:hypothetical protein [Afipia sp. 1NLS2]EFI51355.1 hypothetical protein AfiDRAFT_2728 [Afipia sp. 1NLS2]
MTHALDKTFPWDWWRTTPPNRLDATHRYALRRSLSQIAVLGEPGWQQAVAGDAAEAIGIALPLIHSGESGLRLDVVMSAVLLCALNGNPAAVLMLAHALDSRSHQDLWPLTERWLARIPTPKTPKSERSQGGAA